MVAKGMLLGMSWVVQDNLLTPIRNSLQSDTTIYDVTNVKILRHNLMYVPELNPQNWDDEAVRRGAKASDFYIWQEGDPFIKQIAIEYQSSSGSEIDDNLSTSDSCSSIDIRDGEPSAFDSSDSVGQREGEGICDAGSVSDSNMAGFVTALGEQSGPVS